MSGVNLSIWGSIPEGSERFSDELRGTQCCFMSLCCSVSTCIAQRGIENRNYNLSNEVNKTSELPSEVNKLNSYLLK